MNVLKMEHITIDLNDLKMSFDDIENGLAEKPFVQQPANNFAHLVIHTQMNSIKRSHLRERLPNSCGRIHKYCYIRHRKKMDAFIAGIIICMSGAFAVKPFIFQN